MQPIPALRAPRAIPLGSMPAHDQHSQRSAWYVQVHYGRASLAPVTSLPAYFVFPRAPLDPEVTGNSLTHAIKEAIEQGLTAGRKAIIVLPDQLYLWALPGLQQSLAELNQTPQVIPVKLDNSPCLPPGESSLSSGISLAPTNELVRGRTPERSFDLGRL